jgi:ribosomal protein S18 acetylase RimI-like enzyme
MAAITASLSSPPPQLRPLNILRDLPSVADLVETCFASTLDDDGRRFIQQMRRSGRDNAFIRWAAQVVDTVSMPLSGFVWEEEGKLIGNVSLIPYHHSRQKYYLIANVAVHPNQRRRGIGRFLTQAALEHARQKNPYGIWLHVRDDNPGAITLYRELGFQTRACRSSWRVNLDRPTSPPNPSREITRRHKRDWLLQLQFLRRAYPEDLDWYQPLPISSLRAGFLFFLERFLLGDETRHWVVGTGKEMEAALSWQPSPVGYPDRLWCALPPADSGGALQALLLRARHDISYRRTTLALEYPAGEYEEEIQAAGFALHRRLLWMKWAETLPPYGRK